MTVWREGSSAATAARGDRLARADLAGEKAERLLLDDEEDAGERLLVGFGAKERPRRDPAAEG